MHTRRYTQRRVVKECRQVFDLLMHCVAYLLETANVFVVDSVSLVCTCLCLSVCLSVCLCLLIFVNVSVFVCVCVAIVCTERVKRPVFLLSSQYSRRPTTWMYITIKVIKRVDCSLTCEQVKVCHPLHTHL